MQDCRAVLYCMYSPTPNTEHQSAFGVGIQLWVKLHSSGKDDAAGAELREDVVEYKWRPCLQGIRNTSADKLSSAHRGPLPRRRAHFVALPLSTYPTGSG